MVLLLLLLLLLPPLLILLCNLGWEPLSDHGYEELKSLYIILQVVQERRGILVRCPLGYHKFYGIYMSLMILGIYLHIYIVIYIYQMYLCPIFRNK